MQVTIEAAKADLAKLIEAALKGKEVVIAEGLVPVVKLTPIAPKTRFKIGIWKDKSLCDGPDFFEPMSEADLALWEGGDA